MLKSRKSPHATMKSNKMAIKRPKKIRSFKLSSRLTVAAVEDFKCDILVRLVGKKEALLESRIFPSRGVMSGGKYPDPVYYHRPFARPITGVNGQCRYAFFICTKTLIRSHLLAKIR